MSSADPIEDNNRDVEEARGRRGSRAEYRDPKPQGPPNQGVVEGEQRKKEPPRMDRTEVDSELVRVAVLLPFLHQLRLEELDREFGIYDAVAPLFDPTGWMGSHRTVERNRDVVRILLKAQRTIRKLFPTELPPEAAR